MKKLAKNQILAIHSACTDYATWHTDNTGNKGVWREEQVAHVMGDLSYKGLSRSKFSDRRARDVLIGGRRTEVKSLRCSLDLPVGKYTTVEQAVEAYFAAATATQYVFCYCSGRRCDGGEISLAVMLPEQAKEFMLSAFAMDSGKCRWTCGAHKLDDFLYAHGVQF